MADDKKYAVVAGASGAVFTCDGHVMFAEDVVKSLNRLAHLEAKLVQQSAGVASVPGRKLAISQTFAGVDAQSNARTLQPAPALSFSLKPSSEWHEDDGDAIFVSFSRDEQGNILGETPRLWWGGGYLEEDFDATQWTHVIEGNFNAIFHAADPERFPAT